MARPFFYAVLVFSIGIICGYYFYIPVEYMYPAFVLSFLLLIVFYLFDARIGKNQSYIIPKMVPVFAAFFIFFFGLFSTYLAVHRVNRQTVPFINQEVTVGGRMLSEEADSNSKRFTVRADSIHFNDSKHRVNTDIKAILTGGDISDIQYGDYLELTGYLRKPNSRRNPNTFSYRDYLLQRQIGALLTVYPSQHVIFQEKRRFDFRKTAISVKNRIKDVYFTLLPPDKAKMLSAVVFGERDLMTESIQKKFENTGIMHLTAVSGLHVGFIALMFGFLGKILKLRPLMHFLFTLGGVFFYMLAVGLSTSVVRAGLMILLVLSGKLLKRKVDMLNAAGFAALVILIYRPLFLFTVSFQLSFVVVISLILFCSRIEKLFSFLPLYLARIAAVSVTAQLGIYPLLAYHFNYISLAAPLANIFVVPLSGMIVIIGFIMGIVGLLFMPLASVIGAVIHILLYVFRGLISFFSSWQFARIYLPSPSIFFLAIYYLFFLVLVKGRFSGGIKKAGTVLIIFILLLVSYFPAASYYDYLRITFIDVGAGDSILIQTPEQQNILVDGGPLITEEGSVLPYLLKNGITHLDLVFISHLHTDHYAGLIPVIENIKINKILGPFALNDVDFENPLENRILNQLKNPNINYAQVGRGIEFSLDEGLKIDILHPSTDRYHHLCKNDSSLVLKLEYNKFSLLLTGDIEYEGQRLLLNNENYLSCDILKVPHHGAWEDNSGEFFKKVNPSISVMQVGSNIFGHPDSRTIDHLEGLGSKVYRTDHHGAVMVKTDGEKIYSSSFLPDMHRKIQAVSPFRRLKKEPALIFSLD